MTFRKKRMYKIVGMLIFIFLLGMGGIGGYVKDQMGTMYSDEVSAKKYAEFPYYNRENHEFVSPEKLVFYPEQTTGGDPGFLRFFKESPNAPQFELPKKELKKRDFQETPSTYAVYWLGHSTAIIELDGFRILIDPVFDNAGPFPGIARRFSASPLQREELPDIDLVLITHDHYDHLEAKTIKYLAKKDIQFIIPLGVGARLQGWGVPKENITELGWGQNTRNGPLQITACPTVHYSGRSNRDRNKTLWASYVIKGKERNLYWSGDTGYGEHFKQIGAKYGPFDVAFVEIDAWNQGWPNTHLFPEQVIEVCKDINAQLLFPIHLATFDLALHTWNESIQKVRELAIQNEIEIITPIMGQQVIPGVTITSKWWYNNNANNKGGCLNLFLKHPFCHVESLSI